MDFYWSVDENIIIDSLVEITRSLFENFLSVIDEPDLVLLVKYKMILTEEFDHGSD